MPTVALQLSNVYPAGATVGAYHADTFPGSVPTITATESATMDSAGVATFTTLTPGEEYVAYSSSNGRKVEFKVNKPEGRALISDAGDVDVSGITTGQVLQWQPSSQTWVPLSVVTPSLLQRTKDTVRRRTAYPDGLQPISLRPFHNGNATLLSDGVNTVGTFRLKLRIGRGQFGDIRLGFPNWDLKNDDTSLNPNAITVRAALEFPDRVPLARFIPLYVAGRRDFVVDPGGISYTDAAGVTISPGENVYVRVRVIVPVGGKWPLYNTLITTDSEGVMLGTDATLDRTTSLSVDAAISGDLGYMPSQILGNCLTPGGAPWATIVGDSIFNAAGESGVLNVNQGFMARALRTANVPYVHAAHNGESTVAYLQGYPFRRQRLLSGASIAFCDYGTNDIWTQALTLAQLQANCLTIWTELYDRGASRVRHVTLLPRTTSTDSWATATNQTVDGTFDPIRVAFNDWLRDGAPTVNGVAVATGTHPAVRAGDSGHPLDGYHETADTVEVNAANTLTRNGGRWLTDGSASTNTADGIHPTTAAHTAIAAAIAAGVTTAAFIDFPSLP